ncbi:MAG TPA: lysine--tRNA ligase [Candidatus Limnocylindrales bacterium]|nr:lysine--tRNA ligase [Candidatus Limnocylindrales bacterium]
MFWADELAEKLKKRNLPIEWVDDMKTPSGKVHVGALMGVVIHDLVYKALKDQGVKTKYTYVFENHDPMDDIPSYLDRSKYEKYLGMPLFKIPSPEKGFENFAAYYAADFKKTFNTIGSFPEIIYTKDLYTGGKMNNGIKLVLDNADEIRKIYKEMYKKDIASDWYPFQVYCESCGKVSTTRVYDWDGKLVHYRCPVDATEWTKGCGHEGSTSPFSDEHAMKGKMPWKVEWGAKWQAIGVTIEGAGKDHMSRGGSHDLATLVCERVLKYPVPYPVGYEFMLIGGKKMSSSKGRGFSASDMLEILPPELIRFLIVKMDIRAQSNFDPTDKNTIPHLFDEYQKAAEAYFQKGDEDLARTFELSQINEIKKPPTIRFSVLAQWVQMPNMKDAIEKEGLSEWAKFARVWIERFAPDSEKFAIQKDLPESAGELSKKQKELLVRISDELDKEWDPEEFQTRIYDLGKGLGLSGKETFAAIYTVLIGKDHGPKAAWLILSLENEFIKNRFQEVTTMNQELRIKNQKKFSITYLNNPEIFSINSELAKKYPSISMGIAVIKGVSIKKENVELEKEKQKLLDFLEILTTEELGQYPEVVSYRKLYKEMGVDWHSRRPSPEALLRRVALKKGLYKINTCVDAYNLVVMKHRVSIGAFDLDNIKFPTALRHAKEGEQILLLGDTEPTNYKDGEVAYFDKKGGYNLDFNYRDAQRTAVSEDTKNLYINVDGVYDITPEKVEEVLKEAVDTIIKYCGGTLETFGVETSS